MTALAAAAANFRRLDQWALQDTVIHRLDARAKVLATLAFVVTVASFDRYTVAALLPFALFPTVLAVLGKLPTGQVAKNVALAIPFALVIGLVNPLFDRQVVFQLGSLSVSGGWLSCVSIVVRAVLTLGAALVLVGVTGLLAVCAALERLGMPRVFAAQIQVLYRYICGSLPATTWTWSWNGARARSFCTRARSQRTGRHAPSFATTRCSPAAVSKSPCRCRAARYAAQAG